MQEDNDTLNNRVKIIAWCSVLAAVAIIYIVVTSMNSSKTPTTTSSTPAVTSQTTDTPSSNSTNSASNPSTSSNDYADGTYTSDITYRTPESRESISVTLTLKDGAVTISNLNQSEGDRESAEYQQDFASTYESYVVGKKLSDIQLTRVSGASLTTSAFNEAVSDIASQAGSQG